MKIHKCVLCGHDYTGYGNNAVPFDGRCCDVCNDLYVTPARLTLIRGGGIGHDDVKIRKTN